MGCSGCSSGRGCVPEGCNNNGSCGSGGCNKLNVFDWLANMELPHGQEPFDCVEVRFKNSRKEFFRNVNGLELKVGDIVAVEASPGHDVGMVSVVGELARIQMKHKKVKPTSDKINKIYRIARQSDIDKWKKARDREDSTMFRAREVANTLGLKMKISDVEFQGDNTKAIFYYTADGRVDFRELIKKLADEFRIRVEMKQIGMRQEAGRLGGIGSCGRELCCSTWLTDFRSVSTSAARYQQLSLNPMKLAGQCGKLKCCLNYELDGYVEALEEFPKTKIKLETENGKAFFQKMDIFKKRMWYAYEEEPMKFIELDVDRVNEIIAMNEKGKKPRDLKDFAATKAAVKEPEYANVVGQDSLTRFDHKMKSKKKRKGKRKGRKKGGRNQRKN